MILKAVSVYGPAKAFLETMVSASVSLSASKVSSSTIGPAGLDMTCFRVTSKGTESLNTTVVSSLAVTDSTLASRELGPFGSLIFLMRS